tara:strand:- start:751 stop:1107 length:357 start_codon:yes stop_codon:yes gene_type:complete
MLKKHSRKAMMINKFKKQADIKTIETQVERWDMFARVVPILFVGFALVLVCFGVIDYKQAFWAGLGVFAVTAVTWWFWTIYTIRHLVHTLHRASKNLGEVREEFKLISKEVNDIKPNK